METLRSISSYILRDRLIAAQNEERLALTRLLDPQATAPLGGQELQHRICLFAGHSVGNFVRTGEGISYRALLENASEIASGPKPKASLASRFGSKLVQLTRDPTSTLSNEEYLKAPPADVKRFVDELDVLERGLLSQIVQNIYMHGTPEQRELIERELIRLGAIQTGNSLSAIGTTGVLLALGNLGGFATYTMMSTILSSISMGVLGFGAYTFASSLLSIALGPAGWLALGIYGIKKLGDPDRSKVAQLGVTCAMISQRLRSHA